jgi:cellulose synthase/poly-beta-1,6-N-acetylglucosamine synthase-like glycosyltransferase
MLHDLFFIFFGALLSFQSLYLIRGLRKTPSLPQLDALASHRKSFEYQPKISVIIAAKNEENHIRNTLESLLAQNYPNLEIIFIDDRSKDKTFERARQIHSPKLFHHRITDLPKGWLGKNHALFYGSQKATGDWLLFTDADIQFKKDTLLKVARFVQSNNFDHLTLHPKVTARSALLEDCLVYFQMLFFQRFRPWAIPKKNTAFGGIGAFNLVRRGAYQVSGGHSSISLRPDDDIMLARLLKSRGFQSIYLLGLDCVQVEWYPNIPSLIKGLEKNTFAGCQYKTSVALLIGLGLLVGQLMPFLFLPLYVWKLSSMNVLISFLYLLGLVLFTACFLFFARRLGVRLRAVFLSPFAMAILLYILFHATRKTLKEGGIQWRDTFTPLEKLRSQKEPPLHS